MNKIENKISFDEIYSEFGIFEYENNGFRILSNKNDNLILWSDIIEINVYKKDLYVYDLISMEILIKEKVLNINEETAGWYQFVLKLKEIFKEIPKDWEIEIAQPPFELNFRTILKKC